MEDLKKIRDFLNHGYGYGYGDGSGYGYGYGYGSGDGYGSGSGDGYGDGDGYGSGDGYGYGSGYGSGDGYGYGLKSINGETIYMIDNLQTLIYHIRGNVAKGAIVQSDLTLEPCYIVKQDGRFAHGPSIKAAMEALIDKLMEDKPEEERIAEFVKSHNSVDRYPTTDFYHWHHLLTGSCEMGRKQFAKDNAVDLNGEMTVAEFIKLTENSYGGHIIKKLKSFYEGADDS